MVKYSDAGEKSWLRGDELGVIMEFFTSAFKIARNLLKKKRKEEQVSNSQRLRRGDDPRAKAPLPTKRRIKSKGKGEKIEKQQINIIFLKF